LGDPPKWSVARIRLQFEQILGGATEENRIIGFLRQAEAGMPIKELGRKHGFSDASFYKWRSKYAGMDASEAKRLRELELENGNLKRLLAQAHLDIHALKSVFGTKR
jgi:putative transposase